MMLVHTKPKTQAGGVHGALFNPAYHSDGTPFAVNKLPIASPEKFISKNKINLKSIALSIKAVLNQGGKFHNLHPHTKVDSMKTMKGKNVCQ